MIFLKLANLLYRFYISNMMVYQVVLRYGKKIGPKFLQVTNEAPDGKPMWVLKLPLPLYMYLENVCMEEDDVKTDILDTWKGNCLTIDDSYTKLTMNYIRQQLKDSHPMLNQTIIALTYPYVLRDIYMSKTYWFGMLFNIGLTSICIMHNIPIVLALVGWVDLLIHIHMSNKIYGVSIKMYQEYKHQTKIVNSSVIQCQIVD